MKNVVLDVDGCLADFEGAFCEKFGWEYRKFVTLEYRYPDRKDDIELFVSLTRTYDSLDIIETGIKIARFCDSEGFKIHIVSSRPENTYLSTSDWLKRNKVPFHGLSLVNGSKIQTIKRIAPVFVLDDMLNVVDECAKWGIPSFLMNQPWNQRDSLDGSVHRIKNFDDFLSKFATYFSA